MLDRLSVWDIIWAAIVWLWLSWGLGIFWHGFLAATEPDEDSFD